MSGQLTTHVLNLSRGTPASGLTLQLWKLTDGTSRLLSEAVTNRDGRLDAPLLQGEELESGSYELLFMVGDYFRSVELKETLGSSESYAIPESVTPSFLEQIPIRFNIGSTTEHYHVPLLVAPGGYSTYRGS